MIEDRSEFQQFSNSHPEDLDALEQAFVAHLRASAPVDVAAFDTRVMEAIRKEPSHAATVSRTHRATIAAVSVGFAALAAAFAFFMTRSDIPRKAPVLRTPSAVAMATSPHSVLFTLVASGASRVAVAGSFNGWNTASTPLRRVGKDTWTAEIPLGAGRYVYQFVIDGTRWVPDPRAPRDAGDDFGGSNSVVTVATAGSA
jgi:hypothetical protein